MTSKLDFKKQHSDSTPHDRRRRLDYLGSLGEELDEDDDLRREHDVLAEMVADDEEAAVKSEEEE
jgi:hypothetical protein